MKQEVINLLNKLAMKKYSDIQLKQMANKTEKSSSSAFDIFSDGIDSAEAMIALEIRKLLNFDGRLNVEKMIEVEKETSPILIQKKIETYLPTLNIKDLHKYAFVEASRKAKLDRTQMAQLLGINKRTISDQMKKYKEDMEITTPYLPTLNLSELTKIAMNNSAICSNMNKTHIAEQTGMSQRFVRYYFNDIKRA